MVEIRAAGRRSVKQLPPPSRGSHTTSPPWARAICRASVRPSPDPWMPLLVNGDRDALAQIVVNLLSNAEKYSNDRKAVRVEARQQSQPLPHVEVRVLDRGLGVPQGCEEIGRASCRERVSIDV